jgi:hypothetical protein
MPHPLVFQDPWYRNDYCTTLFSSGLIDPKWKREIEAMAAQ